MGAIDIYRPKIPVVYNTHGYEYKILRCARIVLQKNVLKPVFFHCGNYFFVLAASDAALKFFIISDFSLQHSRLRNRGGAAPCGRVCRYMAHRPQIGARERPCDHTATCKARC